MSIDLEDILDTPVIFIVLQEFMAVEELRGLDEVVTEFAR